MPDVYGFNHLPNFGVVEVRCIEDGCDTGGPINQWPEKKRASHRRTHLKEVKRQIEKDKAAQRKQALALANQVNRENANIKGAGMADKKTPKPTALEQGFPAIYLANDGAGPNFKPGGDAQAKSDLVNTMIDRDLDKRRHAFTKAEAQKLITARGWESHVEKGQASVLAAAARAEKKKAETKAKTASKRTAAKATTVKKDGETVEVTPDPKPVRKPRGRKIRS